MPWDDHATKLTIKAIGTVESNMGYTAVNYNDPITLGIAQWYGTRAAGLLNRIKRDKPAAWTGVASTIVNALNTYPDTNSGYWTTRYINTGEGNSLKPVLNNARDIQNAQFAEDIEEYLRVAANSGMNKDTNRDAVIFFCSMYHQSPRSSLRVLNSVGATANLSRLHAAALNDSVLGRYRTRQNTVKAIILSNDTSGVGDLPGEIETPDPGESDGGESGGSTPGPTKRADSGVTRVELVGDEIWIHRRDASPLVCYPTTTGLMWVPTKDYAVGADVPPEPEVEAPVDTPPPSNPTGRAAAVVKEAEKHLGRYRYSQGPGRYAPETSGYTDCSAFIRIVYLRSTGIDVGMNTVLQWQGSRTREIARGNFKNGQYPNPAQIQPGDLIYYYNGWSGRGMNSVDHVIMAVNSTDSIDMSVNNGAPGPARNKINTKISWSKGPWYLMRVL